MKRTIALLVAGFAMTGCSSMPAASVGGTIGSIRSGTLDARLVFETERGPAGFRLEGPFVFADEAGSLPRANLRYVPIRGGERQPIVFVSDDTTAWIEHAGTRTELDDGQLAPFRAMSAEAVLDFAPWMVDPQQETVGDREIVRGGVDAAALLRDLAGILGLDSDAVVAVASRVQRDVFEIELGRDDRLPRRVLVELSFAATDDAAFRDALGEYAGFSMRLELSIEDPNVEPAGLSG